MEIRVFRRRLSLRTPFRIAHGNYLFRENVFVHLRLDGRVGMGEAPVVPYYGIAPEEIEADLRRALTPRLVHEALEGRDLVDRAFRHPAARCAVRSALSALSSFGVSQETSRRGGTPPTSFTVAYDDEVEGMVNSAANCGFRRLKVKAGLPGDIERIRAIRERLPDAILRVDANQGWTSDEAAGKIRLLEGLGVEFIEEPIRGTPEELERLAAGTSVPILLDESLRDRAALDQYASRAPSVAGIVVKIAKNGGPSESLALVERAEAAGWEAMVSCMVETSLGVAAALPVAARCRWCDLDAPLLIADDPFVGLSYPDQTPVGEVRPGEDLETFIEGLEPIGQGE